MPATYVLGAGGHAKAAIALLRNLGQVIAGAFDDDPRRVGTQVVGVPVLGPVMLFERHRDSPALIAVGDNGARKALAERFVGTPWITAVSPHAHVHPSVAIGPGSIVFETAVVQVDVRLGRHVIVNAGAGIGHDTSIADYAHVAANAYLAGEVRVEEGAFMCIGSTAAPRVTVGAWSTVGTGSAVMRHVPPHCTAIGVPARIVRLKQRNPPRPDVWIDRGCCGIRETHCYRAIAAHVHVWDE